MRHDQIRRKQMNETRPDYFEEQMKETNGKHDMEWKT
jgi:hypothetical protein